MTKPVIVSSNDEFDIYELNAKNRKEIYICLKSVQDPIAKMNIDAMDNTLAGSIDEQKIINLDMQQQLRLTKYYLEFLRSKEGYGAKEFFLPTPQIAAEIDKATPSDGDNSSEKDQHFRSPQHTDFKRHLYARATELYKQSKRKIEQYPHLTTDLDQRYEFVTSIQQLLQNQDPDKRFKELLDFFAQNAAFTKTKMEEYSSAQVQGMKARMLNKNVIVSALVDKNDKKIFAILRNLNMGNQSGYISDEIVNPNMVDINTFDGKEEQKIEERRTFLMAYLVTKVCEQNLGDFKQFFIIGAEDSIEQYQAIGCQTYNNENVPSLLASLNAPGERLQNIKREQLTATEEIASKLGKGMYQKAPSPTAPSAAPTEEQGKAFTL